MINLHERMLPTSAAIEPATSWSPVRRRIQLSHRGRPRGLNPWPPRLQSDGASKLETVHPTEPPRPACTVCQLSFWGFSRLNWLQKQTDLYVHCLQRQGISGFSRIRVNQLFSYITSVFLSYAKPVHLLCLLSFWMCPSLTWISPINKQIYNLIHIYGLAGLGTSKY